VDPVSAARVESELVSLRDVLAQAPAEHQLRPGFLARLTGPLVGGDVVSEAEVRTVLERTAVVDLGAQGRRLARTGDVLVDPDAMEWVRVGRPQGGKWLGKHPNEDVAEDLLNQRRASDERASRDQERRQREAEAERRQPPAAVEPGELAGAGPAEVLVDQVAAEEEPAPAPTPASGPRSCGSCGRPIPGHNRAGVCLLCRSTCPSCGGGKAAQAERCWRCAGRGRGPDAPAAVQPAAGVKADVAGPSGATGDAGAMVSSPPAGARDDDGVVDVADLDMPPVVTVADDLAGSDDVDAPTGEGTTGSSEVVEGGGDPPDDFAETDGPRLCRVCDQQLPRHNHRGICTVCQGTCPSCGGPKAPKSDRCRACRREEPPGPAASALSFAAAVEDVPEMVRELHVQLVTVAEYARELEDELADYRAADRRRARAR
jgi:hypothetical protein